MDNALLARLAEHQATVRTIIDRALPFLTERGAPAPMEMGRLRWEMVRVLTAYQQFKHREIFDPAAARGSPQLARMGEALKADCIAIGDEFTRYVQQWTASGTGERWAEYRLAALAMIGRIEKHLQREQANVTSLLRASRARGAEVWPVRV